MKHLTTTFSPRRSDQVLNSRNLSIWAIQMMDIEGLFRIEKSSASMKKALDGIVEWEFDNRNRSKVEAIPWVRTQQENFGIP